MSTKHIIDAFEGWRPDGHALAMATSSSLRRPPSFKVSSRRRAYTNGLTCRTPWKRRSRASAMSSFDAVTKAIIETIAAAGFPVELHAGDGLHIVEAMAVLRGKRTFALRPSHQPAGEA